MIIKTLTRKEPRFEAAIDYVDKEITGGSKSENFDLQFRIYHNIIGQTKEAATTAFWENYTYKKQRKNGIAMYHEILSFHKEDPVTQKAIEDIGYKYIDLRAPNALVYGAVHTDKEHIHLHLVISSNEVRSTKAVRLDNQQFRAVRREIEVYQREYYPELEKSLVYTQSKEKERRIKQKDTKSREQTYKELQKRLSEEAQSKKVRKKTTDKERVYVYILQAIEMADTLDDFYKGVGERGLEIYKRKGRKTGVIFNNRKYRFTTAVGKERWKAFLEQDKRLQKLRNARIENKELERTKLTREERLKLARDKSKSSSQKKI